MSPVIPAVEKLAVSNIERRAVAACEDALSRQIENSEDQFSVERLRDEIINPLIKEGNLLFDPMIASANATHQLAIATKRKAVGGLAAAKAHVAALLGRWSMVLEDRARVERLRVEKEAADLEAARIERELEAVESSASWPEDKIADVQAIIEAPRALTLPPAPPPATVQGARDVWTAVVFNQRQFYAALGSGETPLSMAEPHMGNLNRRAAADKEGLSIPGVRPQRSKTVSSKRSF